MHAAADVGVQDVPDQHYRCLQALVSLVEEGDVVVLAETAALPARPRCSRVRHIRRPRCPGLRQTRPVIETRPEPLPETLMTGVCPRRAHVLATGGRMTWPASAWKQIQAPCAAANLLPTATARDASWRSLPDCVRPPDEWNLLAVPDAMQQIGHTAQRVGDAETTRDHLGHPA